jgi:AcrR family transcriptional regulator
LSESKETKRARLIEVAIEVIGRYGIKKTNLDDIAKAAGMATTSLYYYFPTKNELIRAAMSALIETLLAEAATEVHSSRPPEVKLVAIWKILFSTTRRSGLLTNLDAMTRSKVLHLTEDIVEHANHHYTSLIQEVLEEGQNHGVFQIKHMELAAVVLSEGVIGLLLNSVGESRFDLIEGNLEDLAEMFLNGVRSR